MCESTVRDNTKAPYPHTSLSRSCRVTTRPPRATSASSSSNALGVSVTGAPPRHAVRAAGGSASHDTICFGDVVVDVEARTATRSGMPCTLTPKAFELLLALVARGGRVVTRQDLLKEVWGYGAFVLSRTVDSHIAELRRKLEEDPARPRHIVTVWKVGYRFEATSAS